MAETRSRFEQVIAAQNLQIDKRMAELREAIQLFSDQVNHSSSSGHLQQQRSSPALSATPEIMYPSSRSRNADEENLQADALSTSPQIRDSQDLNRPDPKPNYKIKATNNNSPLNHTMKIRGSLSWEEMEERMSKGLCLFCDESETPDHHLIHKNAGILMIDSEDHLPNGAIGESIEHHTMNLVHEEREEYPKSDNHKDLVQRMILGEESIPQFQVPIANSEILSNIKLREENSVFQNLVVMNENLEQEWDQNKVNMRFEVGVVERIQQVTSMVKNIPARQLFGKRSHDKERLKLKKKRKDVKSWMFKYKRENEKLWRLHNHVLSFTNLCALRIDGLGTRRKRTLLGGIAIVRDKFRKEKNDQWLGYDLIINNNNGTKLGVKKGDNLSWKKAASDESRSRCCIKKLGGTSFIYKNVVEKIHDENLEILACQLCEAMTEGSAPSKVIGTDWSKRLGSSEISCDMDALRNQESSEFSKFVVAYDKQPTKLLKRSTTCCCKAVYARFHVWLLHTSLIIQQVMRNTKIKFSKRWWFKYKYMKEGMKSLQIQSRYQCRLELPEWFKNWARRESLRKHKKIELFTNDWIVSGNCPQVQRLDVLKMNEVGFTRDGELPIAFKDRSKGLEWGDCAENLIQDVLQPTACPKPDLIHAKKMVTKADSILDSTCVHQVVQHQVFHRRRIRSHKIQQQSKLGYAYSIRKQNGKWKKLLCSRRLVIYKLRDTAKTIVEMYQCVDHLVKLKFANEERKLEVIQSQTFDPGIGLESQEILRSLFQAELLQWFSSNGFMTLRRKPHRSCPCFAVTVSRLTLWSRFFEEGRFDVGNELQMRRLRGGRRLVEAGETRGKITLVEAGEGCYEDSLKCSLRFFSSLCKI